MSIGGKKFQCFTYFLNPLQQSPLIASQNREKNDILREALLRNKVFAFKGSRGARLALVSHKDGEWLTAKLGKHIAISKILPPDKEFEESQDESWPNCRVFINTSSDHKTGQRIFFELKTSIFSSPTETLSSLESALNEELFSYGYAMAINPITTPVDFWDIISKREGEIQELELTFNVPNLLDLKGQLVDALKEVQKKYQATKVSVSIENPNGQLTVPQNDELTKQGVPYIAKGGGKFRIKTKGLVARETIKSGEHVKTITIDQLTIDAIESGQVRMFDILKELLTADDN